MKISLPLHFAAKVAELALSMDLDEEPQASLYSGSLRPGSAVAHRLLQQLIVYLNIGTHGNCL